MNSREHSKKEHAKQGPPTVIGEPNKVGASTPYEFESKNLTAYGGLLPLAAMLEKLEFQQIVEELLTVRRATRAMPMYQFMLAMVLAVYVGFSRLHHLRLVAREPMLTGILKCLSSVKSAASAFSFRFFSRSCLNSCTRSSRPALRRLHPENPCCETPISGQMSPTFLPASASREARMICSSLRPFRVIRPRSACVPEDHIHGLNSTFRVPRFRVLDPPTDAGASAPQLRRPPQCVTFWREATRGRKWHWWRTGANGHRAQPTDGNLSRRLRDGVFVMPPVHRTAKPAAPGCCSAL